MSTWMHSFLSFISAVLIHEAGHIIAAYAVGVKINGISAAPLGFKLGFSCDGVLSYKKELLIISGGIIFNILTAFMPFVTDEFRRYSIGAAVFNALPIVGFDGSGILYTVSLLLFSDTAARRIRDTVSWMFIFTLWTMAVFLNLGGTGGLPMLISAVSLIGYGVKNSDNF